MTTGKIDYRRENRELYSATVRPSVVDVPALSFLTVDGEGDPRGGHFATAVSALYTAAYAVKFAVRKETGTDFAVMPLEGLWHHADPGVDLSGGDRGLWDDRSGWRWTLLIRQPVPVTEEQLTAAREKAAAKTDDATAAGLRMLDLHEGPAVQVLHKGPFDTEPETVALLHRHIGQEGLKPDGRHHEIYLTDFSRTAPERQRTVLRQPVAGL